MNFDYDENLTENAFYKSLNLKHSILIETALVEHWIICVPRAGCFEKTTEDPDFDNDFILSHILVPNEELPGTHFTNLISNNVIVDNKRLLVVNKSKNEVLKDNIGILFEEIIYRNSTTSNSVNKFKLWCLDSPIGYEGSMTLIVNPANHIRYYNIDSFLSAKQFLENEFVKSKFVLKRIQKMCHDFEKSEKDVLYCKELHDRTKSLLNRILNFLLNCNTCIKRQCKSDGNYLKMLKTSIEIYTFNFLHTFLFDQVAIIYSNKCENFNRKIRNYNLYKQEESVEQRDIVLNVAKKLHDVDHQTTVQDKIRALREASINSINSIPNSKKETMASDDLLDILVNAIICTNSPNWIPTKILLQKFIFTETENSENSYLITTTEAAVEFLYSSPLYDELGFESLNKKEEINLTNSVEKSEFLQHLFKAISSRTEKVVLDLLSQLKEIKVPLVKNLCHPLCDCPNCIDRVTEQTLTINSQCSETGDTVLHMVSKFGPVSVMKFVLTNFPDIDLNLKNLKGETCVHLCAKYGQQNMMFQLMHETDGKMLQEVDKSGNSPLHLACQFGHISCVKAILFFAQHKQYGLNINCQNNQGNTCLHEAAQFGFTTIIHSLLEFEAKKDVVNNNGKLAWQMSFNSQIRGLIKDESTENDSNSLIPQLKTDVLKYRLSCDQVERIIRAISFGDLKLVFTILRVDPLRTGDTSKHTHLSAWTNSWTVDGVRPIHAALKHNNLELTKFLLQQNVDLNVKTRLTGQTPFHYSASQREIDAVQYVLENRIKAEELLNDQDSNGNTILHLAIMSGNFKLINFLMKFKLNFLLENREGKTPVYLARKLFYLDLVQEMEYLLSQENELPEGEFR